MTQPRRLPSVTPPGPYSRLRRATSLHATTGTTASSTSCHATPTRSQQTGMSLKTALLAGLPGAQELYLIMIV